MLPVQALGKGLFQTWLLAASGITRLVDGPLSLGVFTSSSLCASPPLHPHLPFLLKPSVLWKRGPPY